MAPVRPDGPRRLRAARPRLTRPLGPRHHRGVRWAWCAVGLGLVVACNPDAPADALGPSGNVAGAAYPVRVSPVGGGGWVRSEPEGIACAPDCEAEFPVGATVSLVAEPLDDGVFLGWAGECAGTAPVCQVTMVGPRVVTAQFYRPGRQDAGSAFDSAVHTDAGVQLDAGVSDACVEDDAGPDGGC